MKTERIESEIFKSYPTIVEEYLNDSGNFNFFPKSFSQEGLFDKAKNRKFSISQREILIKSLRNQYNKAGIELNGKLAEQLERLEGENTFTITTGHQLCLLTGPLYFIIKILQTIKLADQLNAEEKNLQFVPVFWMATEDHDFAEINHVHLFGKTFSWNDTQKGKVGAFKLETIGPTIDSLIEILGESENGEYLKDLFRNSYDTKLDYATATRKLVHELFSDRGILILDGDDESLKAEFSSNFVQEVEEKVIFSRHRDTVKNFGNRFKIQVNPRSLNIFYLDSGLRDLIIEEGDSFKLKNFNKSWSKESLIKEINEHPYRFSPNVVLRPMYQEKILPNICYVGGPAEIAYWLQLKSSFEAFDLPFPILNLRNSLMWLDKGKMNKLNKLSISVSDLFLDEVGIHKKLTAFEQIDSSLDEDIDEINNTFLKFSVKIESMDASMKPVVLAEGRKIEKQLEHLKSKLLKAGKLKNEQRVNSFWNLHEKVFPGGSLHERYDNFAPYFINYGWSFFDQIYNSIDPEDSRLIVIKDI